MSEIPAEGVPAPEVTPEPEEQEESWAGPSRAEWEQTQAQLAQYAQLLQPQQPQYAPQVPQAPDPFSETFQADLDAYVDYRLQGSRQLEQEIRYAQAEDWAMGRFDELAEAGGAFDRDVAYARAAGGAARGGADGLDRRARQRPARGQPQVLRTQLGALTGVVTPEGGLSVAGATAAVALRVDVRVLLGQLVALGAVGAS